MKEIDLQEKFTWQRSGVYEDYNKILGCYQANNCLEYAKEGTVLDLPCGDGTLTKIFAENEKVTKIVGLDASSKHLEIAKEKVLGADFVHGLIEEYTSEEKFDNVFMINVLEHLSDPVATLTHVKEKLLKKDGVICIHVPNAQALNRKIAVEMGTLLSCEELSPFDIEIAGHRRSYDLDSLIVDVEKAGFEIKDTGGVFLKMFSTPQMDWFLKNGLWENGGFGWGRIGGEQQDWKAKFCEACYEIGKKYPRECNIVYVVATI